MSDSHAADGEQTCCCECFRYQTLLHTAEQVATIRDCTPGDSRPDEVDRMQVAAAKYLTAIFEHETPSMLDRLPRL
jgi:hypothetical protein